MLLLMILVTVMTSLGRQYHEHGDGTGEDYGEDLGDDHGDDHGKDHGDDHDDVDGDETRTRQYQGTPATKKRDKWSPSCDSGRRISVFILIC